MTPIDDSTQTPPGYWFGVIEGRLHQRMRETLADLGLRRGSWRILHTLADGPATPDELAERLPHGGDRGQGSSGGASFGGGRGRAHGYGRHPGWRSQEPRDERTRAAAGPDTDSGPAADRADDARRGGPGGELGHGEGREHGRDGHGQDRDGRQGHGHDGHGYGHDGHDHGHDRHDHDRDGGHDRDHDHDGHGYGHQHDHSHDHAYERGFERGFDRGFTLGALRGPRRPAGPRSAAAPWAVPGPWGAPGPWSAAGAGARGAHPGAPWAYGHPWHGEHPGYGEHPGHCEHPGHGEHPRYGDPTGTDHHGHPHGHRRPDRDGRRQHRIHRVLAEFVERGWVWFDGDRATLTDEGRAAHDAAFERVRTVRAELANGISEADYSTTMATLEAMARNLGWHPGGGASTPADGQDDAPSMDA